jgi:hypothetical protein
MRDTQATTNTFGYADGEPDAESYSNAQVSSNAAASADITGLRACLDKYEIAES